MASRTGSLRENGAISDLAPFSPNAINDRGQIVGTAPGGPRGRRVRHASLWEIGKVTDLGTGPNDRSEARGLNELGGIVGFWSRLNLADLDAVVWSGAAKPAAPGERAPRLTNRRPATAPSLRASRRGTLAVVGTAVGVDRQATLRLTVRDPQSGEPLVMEAGTRLAATTLTRQVATVRTMVGAPRILRLTPPPAGQLRRGAEYELLLTATGVNGKRSRLVIGFLA